MSLLTKRIHKRTSRSQPRVEWLEARLFLSADAFAADPNGTLVPVSADPDVQPSALADNLTILTVDPPTGSVLSTAPSAVNLTFDRPVDSFSLGSDDDFDLFLVADDGSSTSIYYDARPSPTESLDDTGSQLVLNLNRQLGPGHYQVTIRQTSMLAGVDGTSLTGAGTDQVVTDFTIAIPGVKLSDATDLGTPTSQPSTAQGSLDLGAKPSDIALYKITLPEGHFWRLGLEVSAQRDGGTLDSALALFDDQGKPIATDDIGRSDFPSDPYLFEGVRPGTYYIGVSGANNLPGSPGGYDLAKGAPGSVPQAQDGGPFTLHVVADPADTPPSLRIFTLDHADPLDSVPTGFSLGFSDAIRASGPIGSLSSSLSSGIVVVDQSGQAWPVVASDFIESDSLVTFLFQDRLPEGKYTVRLPEQGGLTDLAGLSPVALGQPDGVLGTFSVGAHDDANRDQNDFGALSPSAALAGVSGFALLDPGQSITFRVVITFPGIYTFQSSYSGGTLTISRTGADGTHAVDPGEPDVVNGTNDTALKSGVYQLTLTATGAQPVLARLTIKIPSVSLESILENGVGQGPALSLRLIMPTDLPFVPPTPTPTPTPVPIPPPPGPEPVSTAPPASVSIAANAAAGFPASAPANGSQQVPVGLIVSLGGNLVGRPTPEAESVAAVGPGVNLSSIALASNAAGIPQGIGIGFSQRAGVSSRRTEVSPTPTPPPVEDETAPATDGALIVRTGLVTQRVDELPEVDTGWLKSLSLMVADWFSPRLGDDSPAGFDEAPLLSDATSPVELELDPGQVDEVTLASPISVGLLAVLAIQNRRRIFRKLDGKRRGATARETDLAGATS